MLAAGLLLDKLAGTEYDGFAGPVIGADPIIGALLVMSAQRGEEKEGFLIRKEAKGHGTKNMVEGNLNPGMKLVIVEDVVTTGGSLLRAADAIKEGQGEIAGICVLVDREEGAAENISRAGHEFYSIFKVSELL
jgi:orotate phosphoribosyltransferase